MTRSAQAWVAATEVTRAYLAEQYDEALRITDELLERFPDRFASFSQLRAEVLVRLGRPDDALTSAAAVLDTGRWWSDRQVGSLEEEGLDLGEVGAALRSRGRQEVGSSPNAEWPWSSSRPAERGWVSVVVLHMYGVPAAETLEVWEPVVASGVNVATVESRSATATATPAGTSATSPCATSAPAIRPLRAAYPWCWQAPRKVRDWRPRPRSTARPAPMPGSPWWARRSLAWRGWSGSFRVRS